MSRDLVVERLDDLLWVYRVAPSAVDPVACRQFHLDCRQLSHVFGDADLARHYEFVLCKEVYGLDVTDLS